MGPGGERPHAFQPSSDTMSHRLFMPVTKPEAVGVQFRLPYEVDVSVLAISVDTMSSNGGRSSNSDRSTDQKCRCSARAVEFPWSTEPESPCAADRATWNCPPILSAGFGSVFLTEPEPRSPDHCGSKSAASGFAPVAACGRK